MNTVTHPESCSCLDHIRCTHPERMINTRTLNNVMSDHIPVLSTRIYKRVTKSKENDTTSSYCVFENLHFCV